MAEQASITDTVLDYLSELIDTGVRFHPVYILPFIAIGFVLYLYHRKAGRAETGFWGWLFPKDIYLHPSHIVDIKLFALGRILDVLKVFSMLFVRIGFAVLAIRLLEIINGAPFEETRNTAENIIVVTLVITIINDFCVYWVHRIHHETPVLWPFHSVHHSAEVMTPITVYRKHPLYDVFSSLVKSVLVGFTQGLLLALFFGSINVMLIAGANIFYFAFNSLGSNFRHSHVWWSYGRTLEHIFISPAQHQIHHSLEPKHHNKNYGEILAVWDWMFGTLYVPDGYEEIKYGISKSSTSNELIEQPHKTLKDALIVPFKDSWKAIQRRRKKRAALKASSRNSLPHE